MIRYVKAQLICFNPYELPYVEIYIAGCKKGCVGCQNPELANYNQGYPINKVFDFLKLRRFLFDGISILGGDLLDQELEDAEEFSRKLRKTFPKKQLFLFTGNERDDIPNWCYEVYNKIKYGYYDVTLAVEGFPSSTNQRVIEKGKDYK
jgi:organic radical activating enzyme